VFNVSVDEAEVVIGTEKLTEIGITEPVLVLPL